MLFWIIAGIVGLGLYFLSQNKTEKRDKTTITHKRVIQTHDGEVHIHRTQTIDSVQTTYSKQDSTSQAVKNIVDALPHANQTIAAPVSQEIKSEPLIVSEDQPHRFAHYQQESKPESFALTQPKNDIQQDLFEKKQESKSCPNCERVLPFQSFGKSGKYPDGLTKWCLDCLNNHQSKLPKNKKHCPKCNKTRLKSSFYKNSKQPDGLTKWCKTCMDNSKK